MQAQYSLGLMYQYGKSVEQNTGMAIELFTRAARQVRFMNAFSCYSSVMNTPLNCIISALFFVSTCRILAICRFLFSCLDFFFLDLFFSFPAPFLLVFSASAGACEGAAALGTTERAGAKQPRRREQLLRSCVGGE